MLENEEKVYHFFSNVVWIGRNRKTSYNLLFLCMEMYEACEKILISLEWTNRTILLMYFCRDDTTLIVYESLCLYKFISFSDYFLLLYIYWHQNTQGRLRERKFSISASINSNKKNSRNVGQLLCSKKYKIVGCNISLHQI